MFCILIFYWDLGYNIEKYDELNFGYSIDEVRYFLIDIF